MNQEKEAIWKERIKQQKESSLTVTEWCRKNEIIKGRYYYWKKRIEGAEEETEKEKAVIFAEIGEKAVNTPQSQGLKVRYGEIKLIITHKEEAELAAEFISHMEKRC